MTMTAKKPKTVVVDIDGTLAKMNGRGPFDWDQVGEDIPNTPVIQTVTALHVTLALPVIFVSGRMEQCRDATKAWLAKHVPHITCTELHMRGDDDYRQDVVLKREIYDEHLSGLDIFAVFDDRAAVCRMWRALGLTVFQVAEGEY